MYTPKINSIGQKLQAKHAQEKKVSQMSASSLPADLKPPCNHSFAFSPLYVAHFSLDSVFKVCDCLLVVHIHTVLQKNPQVEVKGVPLLLPSESPSPSHLCPEVTKHWPIALSVDSELRAHPLPSSNQKCLMIPPHTSNKALAWLRARFQGRLISRRCEVGWAPHSSDLNLLDFYLWGFIERQCVCEQPTDNRRP